MQYKALIKILEEIGVAISMKKLRLGVLVMELKVAYTGLSLKKEKLNENLELRQFVI